LRSRISSSFYTAAISAPTRFITARSVEETSSGDDGVTWKEVPASTAHRERESRAGLLGKDRQTALETLLLPGHYLLYMLENQFLNCADNDFQNRCDGVGLHTADEVELVYLYPND
jgi:hypothetical protein